MEYIGYAAAFAAGWAIKSAVDRALLNIALRIFTSATGKRKVLDLLAEGIAKLERKP